MTSRCGGFQPDKLEPSFGERHDGIYARFCFPSLADAEYQPLNDCIDEVDPPTGRRRESLPLELSVAAVEEFERNAVFEKLTCYYLLRSRANAARAV
jgi:hypothetical protein